MVIVSWAIADQSDWGIRNRKADRERGRFDRGRGLGGGRGEDFVDLCCTGLASSCCVESWEDYTVLSSLGMCSCVR